MINPRAHEIEGRKVRVRCGECRTTFHERLNRIEHGDRVRCPTCHNEMRFHNIGHIHEHESVEAFIRHVEQRTAHPHFSLSRIDDD